MKGTTKAKKEEVPIMACIWVMPQSTQIT